MANTKSTQHEIPLNGGLNLNKFNAEIKPYEGFNERNSPMYGGCLSPLYIRDNGSLGNNIQYYDGHAYETRNGELYRDGQSIMSFEQKRFVQKYPDSSISGTICDYFDDNNYVVQKPNGDIEVVWRGQVINATQLIGITSYQKSIFYCVTPGETFYALLNKLSNGTIKVLFDNSKVINLPNTVNLFADDVLLINRDYVQINSFIYKKTNTTSPVTIKSPNLAFDAAGTPAQGHSTYGLTNQFLENGINFNFTLVEKNNVGDINTYEFPFVITPPNNGQTGLHSIVSLITSRIKEPFFALLHDHEYAILHFRIPLVFIDKPVGASTNDTFSSLVLTYTFNAIGDTASKSSVWDLQYNLQKCFVKGSAYVENNAINVSVTETQIINAGSSQYSTTGKVDPQVAETPPYIWVEKPVFPDSGHGVDDVVFTENLSKLMVLGRLNWGYESKDVYFFNWENNSASGRSICSTIEKDGNTYAVYPCGIQNVYYDQHANAGWRVSALRDGTIYGISYTDTYPTLGQDYTSYIGTLLTSWGSISNDKNIYVSDGITFFDSDLGSWKNIRVEDSSSNDFTIIQDFLVINTTSYMNCIDLRSSRISHWGSDWNNEIFSYINTDSSKRTGDSILLPSNSITYSSGQNCVNYEKDLPPSIKGDAITVSSYYSDPFDTTTSVGDILLKAMRPKQGDINYVEVYKDFVYSFSYNSAAERISEPLLVNSQWGSDSIRYNLPILFSVYKGVLDKIFVGFGSNVRFEIIYSDNKVRYQYYSNTISSYSDLFTIQGQTYGIQNNQIYSAIFSDGVLQSSTPVVSIKGLTFVANTIYNAYFYSPTARAIYSFGADNNLTMFSQADTVTGITGASYMPSTGSIILGTPDCTYVLNETFGIYRLPSIKNFAYADQKESSILLVDNVNNSWEVSFEKQTDDGWEKQPVILDTQFYGAGSNVVSVNDCWYIRVTDPEHNEGEVKLAVSTLTDIGRTTETKTVKVKETDWDELTDTVYIRFQPKLQRAVGVSLHLESPFKVAYIGVGATPETLQLNKASI